jgi:hypothetical protein
MIRVARDTAGLRLVLEQMLERGHDLAGLAPQLEGKSDEHKARLMGTVTKVTLSPGYQRWAEHLMLLDRMQKLGMPLHELGGGLLATEVSGLQVLAEERNKHRFRHPPCYACGVPCDNRFQRECVECGAKFQRKGR